MPDAGMMGRQSRILQEENYNQYKLVTATHKVLLTETRIFCDSTAAAFTLTLPAIADAKGLTFSIILTVDGGDVTIAHAGDSYNWTNLTMNDAEDGFLLYSDGLVWWILATIT